MRKMLSLRLVMGAVALGILLCGPARAQLGALEKPISLGVRAGGYWPGDTPGGVDSGWLALGADVRVNMPFIPIIGGQTVSLDYLTSSGSNVTGLTLVQRFTSPVSAPIGQGMRPYLGLGFGFYRIHVEAEAAERNKSTVGMKVMGGVDIGKSLYLQGDYHMPASANVLGVNTRGLAVTLGLRF